MPYTLLVGAEGCAETEGRDWIRDATPEEIAAAERKAERLFETMKTDITGRPYFAKTVLDHAPNLVVMKAMVFCRVIRLT